MKLLVRVFSALGLVILATDFAFAAPLSPSFTYQGQLKQDGSLVTGTRHLRFSLWDAAGSGVPPVGGSPIGASHLLTNVTVTNGLFAVLLNDADQFGANAFNGDARWIQIEICADPGCATLTILSPRQPLTATPFARYAAASGGGAWTVSGPDIYRATGKVGIGTNTPESRLSLDNLGGGSDVHGQQYDLMLKLEDRRTSTSGDFLSKIGFYPYGGAEQAYVGFRHNSYFGSNPQALVFGVGGAERMRITNGGNIGIGTVSPGYPLEVASSSQNGTVAYVHSDRTSGSNYAVTGQANGVGADLNVGGYFQATGATNNTAIMVPPLGGNVDIGSYTKLGSDAPAIKTKKLTATSPASNGSGVEVDLGVDMSRILSVAVMINNSGAFWVPPIEDAFNGWGWFLGYPGPTSIRVYIKNRDDCLNRPMKIFITYEE